MLVFSFFALATPPAHEILFEVPFRLKAGDTYIDADFGHAAPLYADYDGDGIRELLVGQFESGKLRIYPNYGTDRAPLFKDFTYFQAEGIEVKLPCG